MPFDREKAIAAWRRPYEVNPAFSAEDIEELEGSLRDRIEALLAENVTEQQAFSTAVKRVGSYGVADTEYRKVFWGKAKRQLRLQDELLLRISMFKNNVVIGLRNLRRHKGYASINILGLAVGFAACLLIISYVRYEFSYDGFHEQADRIYRVNLKASVSGNDLDWGQTAAPVVVAMQAEYPEVEHAVRFVPGSGSSDVGEVVAYEDRRFHEERFWFADSTVFDVFTFPLLKGDPETALMRPNTVVLTQAMAQKYFAHDDPIGKVLRLNNETDYEVTGVLAPLPAPSHIEFDFLASLQSLPVSRSTVWLTTHGMSYILLREGAHYQELEAKFPQMVEKYAATQLEETFGQPLAELAEAGTQLGYYLDPLTGLYLQSETLSNLRTGNIDQLYILLMVAGIILLIACINFINLSTARSANRAREVGVRKALGSQRNQLVGQFLSESVLLSFMALGIALILAQLALPVFNDLTGASLSILGDASFMMTLASVVLGVGLLSGLYPAFVLSAFKAVDVLKGARHAGAGRSTMRSSLVVVQFSTAVLLLIGTGIVFNQLSYMQDKQLGFNGDQVVVLPISQADAMWQRYEAFRTDLLQHSDVVAIAASNALPGGAFPLHVFTPEGAPEGTLSSLRQATVSSAFLEMLEMEVVTGRGFSEEVTADERESALINEAAAKQFGWNAETAVGKHVSRSIQGEIEFRTIVGVVKDFHFDSLHERIGPLILMAGGDTAAGSVYNYVSVRIRPERIPETLAFLERTWTTYEPGVPYQYSFLDEDFAKVYEADQRAGKIFGYATVLAIMIACLGLFGLAAFITEQRTKEIGVRKVLGASVAGIVVLLSKDFLKLVGLAFIVAVPVAYFAMTRWLESFAYRIEIGPALFLLTGGLVLLIAVLTVSYQSIKTALEDPVRSLRHE